MEQTPKRKSDEYLYNAVFLLNEDVHRMRNPAGPSYSDPLLPHRDETSASETPRSSSSYEEEPRPRKRLRQEIEPIVPGSHDLRHGVPSSLPFRVMMVLAESLDALVLAMASIGFRELDGYEPLPERLVDDHVTENMRMIVRMMATVVNARPLMSRATAMNLLFRIHAAFRNRLMSETQIVCGMEISECDAENVLALTHVISSYFDESPDAVVVGDDGTPIVAPAPVSSPQPQPPPAASPRDNIVSIPRPVHPPRHVHGTR